MLMHSVDFLAERAVQTVKERTKLTGPLEVRVVRFSFKYRVIPQCTTEIAPTELIAFAHIWIYSTQTFIRSIKNKVSRNRMQAPVTAVWRYCLCMELWARTKVATWCVVEPNGAVAFQVQFHDAW